MRSSRRLANFFRSLSLSPPMSGGGGAVPANTVAPVASGTPTQGQVLSTTNGTWTNSPTGYVYQWNRGGVPISGASSSTYTLVLADVGANVNCTVTAVNGSGTGQATSNTLGPVASAVPAYVSGAGITGTPTENQVLTAVAGTWTNSPSYTYQWRRNGSPISGATASTYTLVTADVGATITVTITGTNGFGSASTTTAGVGPVASAPVGNFLDLYAGGSLQLYGGGNLELYALGAAGPDSLELYAGGNLELYAGGTLELYAAASIPPGALTFGGVPILDTNSNYIIGV